MCITFFYVNPAPTVGSFRLVVAFNRDEALDRATEPVKWKDGVLCGRDMTPGKEGGTWLGISRSGRVGMLTNITTGKRKTEHIKTNAQLRAYTDRH